MSETLLQRTSSLLKRDQSWFLMWRGRRPEIKRSVANAITSVPSLDTAGVDLPTRYARIVTHLATKLVGYPRSHADRCVKWDPLHGVLTIVGHPTHPDPPKVIHTTSHVMTPEPWDEDTYEAQVAQDIALIAETLQARCKTCPMELQCLLEKEESHG